MSTVHDRWELVAPLLLARTLRDPSAFRSGETKRSHHKDLEAIRREHRFEEAAIAEAFHLMDGNILQSVPADESIHAHLTRVATRWLIADGDHWALRLETRNPGHEIVRWRCLTMLLPPGIMAAAALSTTTGSCPCWVQVLPDSIAPREPVGHLHVHLGPILPFEVLWLQLSHAFLRSGTLDAANGEGIEIIEEEGIPEIARHADKRRPGMLWKWILELAFAARVWLQLPSGSPPPVLRDFGHGRIDLRRRAGALLALWSPQGDSRNDWRSRARREARRLAVLREQSARHLLRTRLQAARAGTPSNDTTAQTPTDNDEEVVFLADCLRRCSRGSDYERIFYQYLRVKTALYGRLVVDPWTTGLRHFLEVVMRDKPYSNVIGDDGYLDEVRLEAVRREKPLRIGATEIHVHPGGWIKRFPRHSDHRHDWILSFTRAEKPKKNDTDGGLASRGWKRMAREVGTMCRFLARCMLMRPRVLQEVRGIGLMDWERNGPVWLFESSFRRLIEASAEVAAGHPRLRLQPLRTAFHLGEDFDHLLSGLRQIFEPFEWGLIQRGDRVGHALALGLDPRAWCERFPWIRMRRWDRILDIGFVYWAFEKLRLQLDSGHLERLRVAAGEALQHVFRESVRDPLVTTRNVWLALPQTPPRSAGGTDVQQEGRRLRDLVLEKGRIGRDALELSLPVETKLELAVIEAIHKAVHDCVTKTHVAVEVNPSSNLLIGGFRSIFEQPVFHTEDFPITLNADDPLTFGTTLADDYAYAWAGMVLGSGRTPREATRRLEEAARCSMRFAFGDHADR